ncbi:hypothetical protein ACTXT7_015300 [Hymenolepis weldensis]
MTWKDPKYDVCAIDKGSCCAIYLNHRKTESSSLDEQFPHVISNSGLSLTDMRPHIASVISSQHCYQSGVVECATLPRLTKEISRVLKHSEKCGCATCPVANKINITEDNKVDVLSRDDRFLQVVPKHHVNSGARISRHINCQPG